MSSARRHGLTAVAIAAALAGCSSNGISTSAGPSGDASTPPPSVNATSPTPSGAYDRSALLQQYGVFWRTLAPASRLSAGARRGLLAPVTTDPELSSLLQGIARERAKGRVFYGAASPRPTLKQFSPPQQLAVVDDCQDASKSGVALMSSGRHITSGTTREHVVVTMHLGSDDRWRVAFVSFPKTPC